MQRVGLPVCTIDATPSRKSHLNLGGLLQSAIFTTFLDQYPKKVVNRLHQSFRSLMMMVLGFVFMAQDLSVHFVRQVVECGIQVSMGTFAK